MRLKSIKVVGFKSFASATTISFANNLSAIVGPNGCGKSNVIDAIRWVMGESSAKQLRGDAMSDVIFAGTSQRKPVGMASVELNFENTLGKVGGDYRMYNELSIKRQVTRDGGSTYYINNSKCRRRDITDIFLGTGLGPRSYAVIEQGMISRLVEARPDDLRQFIEEAAGVSKYQARRKETLTHLAHTQDNLARLADIKSELDQQIRALKKQASAADRYKDLQKRLQNSKIALYTLQFGHASHLHNQLATAQSTARQQYDQLVNQRQALDAQMQQHNTLLQQQLATNNQLQQSWQNAERQLTEAITRDTMRNQQISQLDAERHQVQGSLQQLATQLASNQTTLSALQVQLQQHSTTDTYHSTLQQLSAQINQLTAQLSSQQNSVAELTLSTQSLKDKQQHLQSNVAQARTTEQQLQVQLSKLDTNSTQNGQSAEWLQQLQQQWQQQQAEAEALQGDIAQLTQQIAMLGQQSAKLVQQCSADKQLLDSHKQQQTKLNAELATQQQFLQQLRTRLPSSDPIAPPLAEQLTLSTAGKPFASLIETLLGPWFATAVISDHAQLNTGHSMLLATAVPEQPIALPITATPLLALIDSPALAIAQHWYIAEQPITQAQLPALLACISQYPALVVSDGNGFTVMAGFCGYLAQSVYASSPAHTGLLTLPESILALQQSCSDIGSTITSQDSQLATAEQQLAHASSQLSNLRAERQQLQQRQTALQHSNTLLQQKLQHQQTQDTLINEQRLVLTQQLHACVASINSYQAPLHGLAQQIVDAEQQLQALQGQSSTLLAEQQQLQQAYNNTLGKQAQAAQTMLALQKDLQHTQQQMILLNAQQQSQQNRLADLQAHVSKLQQQANPQQLATLQQQVSLNQAARQQQQATQQALQIAIQALNQQRLALQTSEETARSQLEATRLDCQQQQNKMNMASEHLSAIGAAVQLNLIALTPHELAQTAKLEQDYQTNITSLQHKILALGALNLAAPDELEGLQSRQQELDTQMQDLAEACSKLQTAMSSIDQETRNVFMSTFANINTSLGEVFPTIFGGGHAELTLEEGWQSGVKLMAQPPGKRNSSITLLSGGEKTLTALALVFAIFALNPSPFCVLDEVDAPLDDTNVKRYCNLVQSLAGQVQFIYITHNKLAMEMADTLLGVTMPEAGVSQVVSVSMQQAAHFIA